MPHPRDYPIQLREEAQRELAPRIDALKENLRSFQQNLAESLSQLEEKARDIGTFEMAAAEGILAEAVDQITRQKDEEMSLLANFIVEIQQKETQEEILSLYLEAAHRYSPRIVLFVVRGPNLTGWSSRGFSENTAHRVHSSSLARDESPALKGALECGSKVSVTDVAAEMALSRLLDEEAGTPWHVFPMKAMEHPVAVLLASGTQEKSCSVDLLLVITATTQLCIENIALKILREIEAQPAAEKPVPAVPVTEALEPEEVQPSQAVAEEIAEHAEVEAPTEPMSTQAETAESEIPAVSTEAVPEPEPVQSVTSDLVAAGQEEVPPQADETVPQAPEAPEVQIISAGGETAPGNLTDAIVMALAVPVSETVSAQPASPEKAQQLSEEEKNHADAKRFARLLVSEIKLYNERRVLDGRRNRDIYVRLKKDIDRSREMYSQRIAPSVARKVDYFHDEVLRILGDNDPSTLGSDYPGPEIAS